MQGELASKVEQTSYGGFMENYVIDLEKLGIDDVERVGGKNASLGEMIRHLGQSGVMVPGGFATTRKASLTRLAEGSPERRTAVAG